MPPGLAAQRLQAVQAIAADLRKALVAHEARANARGFSVPQLLSNAARGGGRGGHTPQAGGIRRWQDLDSSTDNKNLVLDIRRGSAVGGNGARASSGASGRGARGVGPAAGASGGRRTTAVRRGFYTEPDDDDLYDDTYIDDGEGDPDSEYEYAPRSGARRRRGLRGSSGGSARAANGHPSREERARRREQNGSGGQQSAGGGGRRAGRGRGAGAGSLTLSSDDDEEEEDEDEDEDDVDGSRRRGRGKRKGKGKGKSRGSGSGRGSSNGRNGGGEGALPVIPDEFNSSIVAVGSDDEADEGGSNADHGGRGRDRIIKVNRKSLECALCHKGDSPEHPLPGRVVGVHPVMEGTTPLWVHDGCALYSPMVCRDEGTDALCNITAEVGCRQSFCSECFGT